MFAVYADSFSSDDPLSGLVVGERPEPVRGGDADAFEVVYGVGEDEQQRVRIREPRRP